MKIRIKLTFGLLIILLFVSCGNNRIDNLKVGLILWPPLEFFYLADNLGYYKGHQIELISYSAPSEAIRAYKTGSLDVLLITNQIFIRINDDLLSDRIIMVVDFSSGADQLLVHPGIDTFPELKGKRLGVESSALGAYVMLRALDLHGIPPEEVIHVSADAATQPIAFRQGKIDGVITFEPVATQIKKMGAIQLFSSEEIPYEIADILISTPRVIKEKRKQLTALCNGFFKAHQDFQCAPEKYTSSIVKRAGITEQEFINSLSGVKILDRSKNLELFKDPYAGFYYSLTFVNQKMIEFGLAENSHGVGLIIDNSIMKGE